MRTEVLEAVDDAAGKVVLVMFAIVAEAAVVALIMVALAVVVAAVEESVELEEH